MFLFFDTETTGLPRNWQAPMHDLNNWPRVIQLAYARYDTAGKLIEKSVSLVKPDGWEVPTGQFWQEHGYTTAANEAKGVPMPDLLIDFCAQVNICGHLVAHNMSYDHNVLGAEMLRYGVKPNRKPAKICTKEAGTDFCHIPGTYGTFKWPKLSELHTALFGCDFDGAHDAAADVEALAACFFEMRSRGIIQID